MQVGVKAKPQAPSPGPATEVRQLLSVPVLAVSNCSKNAASQLSVEKFIPVLHPLFAMVCHRVLTLAAFALVPRCARRGGDAAVRGCRIDSLARLVVGRFRA